MSSDKIFKKKNRNNWYTRITFEYTFIFKWTFNIDYGNRVRGLCVHFDMSSNDVSKHWKRHEIITIILNNRHIGKVNSQGQGLQVRQLLPVRSALGHHPKSQALQVNSSCTYSFSLQAVQIQQQLTSPFRMTYNIAIFHMPYRLLLQKDIFFSDEDLLSNCDCFRKVTFQKIVYVEEL